MSRLSSTLGLATNGQTLSWIHSSGPVKAHQSLNSEAAFAPFYMGVELPEKFMKENWYQLEYEKCEKGGDCAGPTVLYTSRSGLNALVAELQKITASNLLGRHELAIDKMDSGYDAPFTHIEVAEQPPVSEEPRWSWKPFAWFGAVVVGVLFLALYGAVRLVIDIVT